MNVENGPEGVKVDDEIGIRYREGVGALEDKRQYGLQPECAVGLTLVSKG